MSCFPPCSMINPQSCINISQRTSAPCTTRLRKSNVLMMNNPFSDFNGAGSMVLYGENCLHNDHQYQLVAKSEDSFSLSDASPTFNPQSWFDSRGPLEEVICRSSEKKDSFLPALGGSRNSVEEKMPSGSPIHISLRQPEAKTEASGKPQTSKINHPKISGRERCSGSTETDSRKGLRFSPYPKPVILNNSCKGIKTPKPRKRKIVLMPKDPKYEGLSHFAAPPDLVSEILPCDASNSFPNSAQAPTPSSHKMRSYNKRGEEESQHSASEVPIDFLLHLDEKEWLERKKELENAVEARKNVFIEGGFAETSGKAFEPDEQSLEKKPVPNRWVWYMRLSMDYDRLHGTKVPSGGPAGYLKYGWDRMGSVGKQPYQELADIYAAQRQKFMVENGIEEDLSKKSRAKTTEKPSDKSPQKKGLFIDNKNDGMPVPSFLLQSFSSRERSATPSSTQDMEASSARIGGHRDFFYNSSSTLVEADSFNNSAKPSPLGSPLALKAALGPDSSPTANVQFVPSYLQSPEFATDFFSSIENQDLLFVGNMCQERSDHLGSPFSPVSQGSNFFDFPASLATPSDLASFSTPDVNNLISPISLQGYQPLRRDCFLQDSFAKEPRVFEEDVFVDYY